MSSYVGASLAEQIERVRKERGLSKSALAERVDRPPSRLSEFDKKLREGVPARDRMALFLALCDVLGVVPVLVPREVSRDVADGAWRHHSAAPAAGRVFDEVFVDLGSDLDGEGS